MMYSKDTLSLWEGEQMDFWVDLKNIKYPDPDEIHADEIAAVKDRFGEGAEYHWSDTQGAVMVRVFHQNPVFEGVFRWDE